MTALPQEKQEKRGRGRPLGSLGGKTSKLRRLANRLKQLAETSAINIVQRSLDGGDVDKEQLATAKFTINSAKQFHQAVIAEEENKKLESQTVEDTEIEVEEHNDGRAVFKLHVVKSED